MLCGKALSVRWPKHQMRKVAFAVLALCGLASRASAQSNGILDVTPQAEAAARALPALDIKSGGQADVAFLGYYLGSNGQPLIDTSGMAVNVKEFLPGIGLLHASVEGYGGGGFHMGTSFLALEQVPMFGWHWDFTGGDSQVSSNLVASALTNIYTPEISTRGLRIAVKRTGRSFQFFMGKETLLGGPRIPYRVELPQQVLGATIQQDVGKNWQIGVRFLHLTSGAGAFLSDSNDLLGNAARNNPVTFFLPGHEFQSSNGVTLQSAYRVSEHLKFFSEAGYSKASTFVDLPVSQQPFSMVSGAIWNVGKLTVQGNYVFQSTTYMPLLGYFAGDRKGPYGEAHYRLNTKIDLYGSGSVYSNNIEQNQRLPSFHSASVTGGASFALPWKLNANASVSTLSLTARQPLSEQDILSNNRQVNLGVNRTFGRHNLRFSLIDMKLNSNLMPQNQRFEEFGDNFAWKHLVLGGAVRVQQSQSTESRQTLFFRGSIQANIKRLSIYANFEKGNDLANQTVFSTNAYSSTVAGVSTPLAHGWTMQLETYRNRLNTALNPENVFLFPTANLGAISLPDSTNGASISG